MNFLPFKLSLLSLCIVGLTACQQAHVINKPMATNQATVPNDSDVQDHDVQYIDLNEMDQSNTANDVIFAEIDTGDFKAEDAVLLDIPQWTDAHLMLSSKTDGVQILNHDGKVISKMAGQFGRIDYRTGKNQQGQMQVLFAIQDLARQQLMLRSFDVTTQQWSKPSYVAKRPFKSDDNCLYQDQSGYAYAFLVGEEGIGEQWLVAKDQHALSNPQLIRRMSLPPNSNKCRVSDHDAQLFINEEEVGIWAYPADPEADLVRRPVDMVKPFGAIQGTPTDIAVVDDQIAVTDESKGVLYRYQWQNDAWQALSALKLSDIGEAERLGIIGNQDAKKVLILDDHTVKTAELNWQTNAVKATTPIGTIPADVQSDVVPSTGDAADDPAIWYNASQPSNSRVLGTDKQGGLAVYDLHGKMLQYLDVGRLNNVDLRYGFHFGTEQIDLAIATNRDHNSLQLFAINAKGKVSNLGELATDLTDIYGFCMYQDRAGEIYAIPNDKDGTFVQYHIQAPQKKFSATEVQRFAVDSQPEGCVVDDATGRAFVGEERNAVWMKDLNTPNSALEKVISAGDVLHADIEGMGLYHAENHAESHDRNQKARYLIISSQGNDSYVVIDSTAPYQVRGAFRVGINTEKSIDAVSETDGLEVSSKNFGGANGMWKQGMLVVQDGRKRMPEGNQNFKYVSWQKIAEALNLE
ncbi:3-phytase [Acinetobacter marinus]|uniref:3-phytase n=1 Tax=Acinetobacter marinus TaxID=281375 RepID=A0A1G6GMM5_9GAMM|nr:phytase [Acinetobacter marinus]SDB83103.1 3-phytase [Acinetobacter marinus]